MFYKVKKIKALDNFILEAEFLNGVKKTYDVKPLFKRWPVFKDLKNIPGLFKNVHVDMGGFGIAWNENIDLACEELWEGGSGISNGNANANESLYDFLYTFIKLRKEKGITQQKLEELTGVKQSVIARFETGAVDTRLSTIETLAEAVGYKIKLIPLR
ncbi:MAG: DUF2442 domain-containing protein [Elusimicrobiota bacterium]|jgi:DNA-binding XRE family transcriptional regulator|nr:DUF2442 domain-containing protein [Elusimicrobiota bacterium]